MSNMLQEIQNRLKVPKNQYNNFGGYYYRSLEDILDAVKPLLAEYELSLQLSDEPELVGDNVYIRAIAEITDADGNRIATASAVARHADTKKGMDDSQITGATSSYARKYCLNGLFAIDDTKDADAVNTHEKQNPGQTMTRAEGECIKRAREDYGLSHDAVKAIMKTPPMSCENPPFDLQSKYVDTILERIYQEGNKKET